MDRRLFDLPVVYRNTGFAPRSRWQGEYLAVGRAAIAIPVADPRELDPALVYSQETGGGSVVRVEIMQCRGMLVRRLQESSSFGFGRPLCAGDLSAMARGSLGKVPEPLRPRSTASAYGGSVRVHPRDALNRKRIETDGFAAAVEELQRQVDRNVVMVGDMPYVRAPDPCWAFRKGGSGWLADLLLFPEGSFTLPGHRTDLAHEFAGWARERHGIAFEMPWHRELEAVSTFIPYSHNPVVRNAASMAECVFRHRANAGFGFGLVDLAAAAWAPGAGVAEALAFVAAVEEIADDPDATSISPHLSNAQWVDLYWKAYELLPEGYKVDPGDEDLLSLPTP